MPATGLQDPKVGGGSQAYPGHRILEAMHSAQRYAEAVFEEICAACPASAHDILDFGAGDGMFLARFVARGRRVDCVEPDTWLQQQLRGSAATIYADISAVPAASYDFVYSVNVLEHIQALDHALAQLYRVMRTGALMFVFVPAFNVLWTGLDDEVGHVRRFSGKTLRLPLLGAEFEIRELRYFDSLGFPAALAVRALEKVGLFRYSGSSVGFYDRHVFPVSRVLDRVVAHAFGKNIVAVVRKPHLVARE